MADELRRGMVASFEREITCADVEAFGHVTGDLNPLHVDRAYAETTAMGGPIAHGVLQMGLASAMVGMHLPGRRALLLSASGRFLAPLRVPARVKVQGELTAWNAHVGSGTVRVTVSEAASQTACSEMLMTVSLHEDARDPRPESICGPEPSVGGRALVLITGAAGGLGRVLARELARDHSVVGVVHREAMPADLREAGVEELNADLDGEVGFGALADRLGSCRLRAVVHAAWPGAPRGGLLSAGDEGIRRQVEFGTLTTIRLARLLASRAEAGARMVAIGSTAASIAPSPSLAIYALGKSCLEQAVRFLAPELARKGIAVNAVCPSFVPVGINRGAGERQRLMEQASVPMGRLCTPEDVAGVVRFLLGPGSEFLSGQVFGLTGGSI